MATYRLPSHPSLRWLDRFSRTDVAEDDDGLVPLWPILVAVLSTPVVSPARVGDILDEIAVTLRDQSNPQGYDTLADVLSRYPGFVPEVWPRIVAAALAMPDLFPAGELPLLAPGGSVSLSCAQAACVVAHQFLGTLLRPPHRKDEDAFYEFSLWYGSAQRHPAAARMYVSAVVEFFRRPGGPGRVTYSLREAPALNLEVPLVPVSVAYLDTHTTAPATRAWQGPGGATIVSANKVVGFGASATQEEVYVGTAPEAAVAVLLTPVLGETHALVVDGARPVLAVTGERRDVVWDVAPEGTAGGTLLFIDAEEMDEAGGSDVEGEGASPDLAPAAIERELRKVLAAFAAPGGYPKVSTPLWGCGAFCGDPAVKLLILWLAASAAGVGQLQVLVAGAAQHATAQAFEAVVERLKGGTAAGLRDRLGGTPRASREGAVFDWMARGG